MPRIRFLIEVLWSAGAGTSVLFDTTTGLGGKLVMKIKLDLCSDIEIQAKNTQLFQPS